MTEINWHIFGSIVLIVGIIDSLKYRILTKKIYKYQSSRGNSRMFTNIAIAYKLLLSIWAVFYLKDWVVSIGALLALATSLELFWAIYLNYPYKYRNLLNFRRPNLLKYIYNSFLPNKKSNRI